MKMLRRLTVAALALGLVYMAAAVGAAEKGGAGPNPELLVGKWEVTKGQTLPKGSSVEFAKDGKVKLNITDMGKTLSLAGSYAVDGSTLKVTLKGPDGKDSTEKMTIEKLSATDFATKDAQGKVDEFKKVSK